MTNRRRRDNAKSIHDAQPIYYEYLDGITGKYDDDGNLLPNASYGLTGGNTWVRLDGSREGAAILNPAVNPYSPGIPVLTALNRRSGRREIVSMDFAEAVRLYGVDVARRIGTPAPQLFDSEALLIGKVEPASGLRIYVRRFVHDVTEFPGAFEDLSSIISGMTASTQEMVLVGLDEDDNTISVTEGAERSLVYAFQQADADAITLPDGIVPLAGLVLRADQTASADSFVPRRRFFDRRQFLNIASGSAAASDFDNIMTDGNGDVMVDGNGNVMVAY